MYRTKSSLQIGDNDLIGNKFNGHDLHIYLQSKGIGSKHLVWNKESDDVNTFEIARDKLNRNDLYKNVVEIQRQYSLNGTLNPIWYDVLLDPLFLNSELVHFHLIHNGLVDVQLLPLMSKIKPIVWTLHDPWALSGHCIEHIECEKWKYFCYDCPHLELPFPLEKDFSFLNFEIKKTAIQNSNMEIIVASKMMFDKVKASPIFKNKNIHLIPFGINRDIFKLSNKSDARRRLNIPESAFVISFRSDTRYKKGVDYVENVIKNLKTERKVYFLVFGGGEFKKNDCFKYIEYGWVKDDLFMVDVYNASDLFLMPSTIESFGLMAIEAMSCGTLPIVLEGTALPDTVNASECGIATKRDKKEYLGAVQFYVDHDDKREERAKKCLDFAKNKYDKDAYLDSIISVYEESIKNHRPSAEDVFILNQLKKNAIVKSVNSELPAIKIENNPEKNFSLLKHYSMWLFLRYKNMVPKKIRMVVRKMIRK